MITVISTGFRAPTKQKCLASVSNQSVKHEHWYIEASEQDPPISTSRNIYSAVRDLPADRIVVSLDGDDWLAHNRVLEHVLKMYEGGADLTYGSFVFSDGRAVNGLRAYDNPKKCRQEPWLATHLKTFRAGLLHRIPADQIICDDCDAPYPNDMAIMLPMLEIAEKPTFCKEILCVYNYASSWEHRMTTAEQAQEREFVRLLRANAFSSAR